MSLGTFISVTVTLVSLILYELWEVMVQIEEAPTNRFTDVVFGMLGFLPVYLYFSPQLSKNMFFVVFGIMAALNLIMSVIGWHASQKAAVLKERLRKDLALQRQRFLSHRIPPKRVS
jgi:hypothetical protein